MERTAKQFPKRNTILACLQATKTHPSAEDLHRLLSRDHPDISLATVYRNLSRFKADGLIQSIGYVAGIERFDGCIEPHSHLVCRQCGCVDDAPASPLALCSTDVRDLGWQAESAQLTVYGLCPRCQSSTETQ